MNKTGFFVTGTDTGIGKTVVSAFLIHALRMQGQYPAYWKPIQTGPDSDTRTVAELTSTVIGLFPKPSFHFPAPEAPLRAARLAGSSIQLQAILSDWENLPKGCWIVEGVGGMLVPLTATESVRDLVKALGLPLIVVASTRLGTLNHTLLTVEAARRADLSIEGIILVGNDDLAVGSLLEELSGLPILFELPTFTEPLEKALISKAQDWSCA